MEYPRQLKRNQIYIYTLCSLFVFVKINQTGMSIMCSLSSRRASRAGWLIRLAEPYPYHVLQPLQRPLRHSWGPQRGNILGKRSLLGAPGVLQTFHTTQMESQQAKCPPSINCLLYGMLYVLTGIYWASISAARAPYHTVMYRCYSAPANYRVVHLVFYIYGSSAIGQCMNAAMLQEQKSLKTNKQMPKLDTKIITDREYQRPKGKTS